LGNVFPHFQASILKSRIEKMEIVQESTIRLCKSIQSTDLPDVQRGGDSNYLPEDIH